MTHAANQLLRVFGSLRLTVVLLALCMVLVFVATIAQVKIGIHQAQVQYFRSWVTLIHLALGDFRLPLPLPGGLTLGTLLIANLL
ncbi:MAG: ResB protein required for cytochrome C biosynthesis, partial [Verrucomicrobiota bacterium]|nr:ResB protein required for cytochrome C biosynthesis [Verrucomicrobiota bacterium]